MPDEFRMGDRVRVRTAFGGNASNAIGVITGMDTEDNGYYDDDDNYVPDEYYIVYQVTYETPVVHAYGTDEFDYYNEDDLELESKRERVPTGFAKFIKSIEVTE